MQAPDRIAELIFNHVRGLSTDAEDLELHEWAKSHPSNAELLDQLTDPTQIKKMLAESEADKEEIWNKIVARVPELATSPPKRIGTGKWWIAAAVVIVAFAVYVEKSRTSAKRFQTDSSRMPDRTSSRDKAILKISGQDAILLGKSDSATIEDKGIQVARSVEGEIEFDKHSGAHQEEPNTLSTPRGGQYRVVLSDGTKIWLNAASEIKFPTVFSGDTRRVELSGEAYFEVAKDPKMPFEVVSKNIVVRVLGTHFNVSAYNDDSIASTTLLEGKVLVSVNSEIKTLTPGEQARIEKSNPSIAVSTVNTDDVVGWKNGVTIFRNADVKTIMKIISRWYAVDVEFVAEVAPRKLSGGIPRNASLAEVIKVLESYDIHCKENGKKLIVMQ